MSDFDNYESGPFCALIAAVTAHAQAQQADEKRGFTNANGMTEIYTFDEALAEIVRLGEVCERHLARAEAAEAALQGAITYMRHSGRCLAVPNWPIAPCACTCGMVKTLEVATSILLPAPPPQAP